MNYCTFCGEKHDTPACPTPALPQTGFTIRVGIHYDAAWEVYYQLADRRTQPGLTFTQLKQVIDTALGEQ